MKPSDEFTAKDLERISWDFARIMVALRERLDEQHSQSQSPPDERTDPRPTCIRCGKRWVPPEGYDATVAPCYECYGKPPAPPAPEIDEATLRDFYIHWLAGWVDKDWGELNEEELEDVRGTYRFAESRGAERGRKDELERASALIINLETMLDDQRARASEAESKLAAAEKERDEAKVDAAKARQILGAALRRLQELGESSFDLDRPSTGEGGTGEAK